MKMEFFVHFDLALLLRQDIIRPAAVDSKIDIRNRRTKKKLLNGGHTAIHRSKLPTTLGIVDC